jgi:bifunctional non-homologous end joining protein LigD
VAADDRLSDYNAKRDFAKTREPKGRSGHSRRNALGLYVQVHAARRLHYDLRLEWDGVLLSWAVTRGPSSDPTQKRLAVRTEDHPLSYAQFEGTIPKKEYGGGTVMLWDRGTWTPRGDAGEGLANGKLSFTAHGERMQGGWTLVRMQPRNKEKRENWLLIKERDEHAGHDADELTGVYTTSIATARTMDQIAGGVPVPREARRRAAKARSAPASRRSASAARGRPAHLPRFHKPQLATLVDTVPDGDDWLHETKFDGYRCITSVAGKASAPYRGRRTRSWLKIKCSRRQEFVVGGFTPSDKRGRAFASILVGTYDGKRLRYRGRVGSGFAKKDLDALGAAMSTRQRKTPPFDGVPDSIARNARWLRPDLVAEVDFTEFTDAGHVRHGVFKGLREDKRPGQVTLERAPRMQTKAGDEYRGVRISNPHRVVYPRQGVTKAELAHYYDIVGARMLPLMRARPLSLLRCPKGRNDKCFFQKHGSAGFPVQIARVPIAERSGRRAEYLYIDDVAGLIAGVQMGTLEFHTWGSRIDSLEKPDRLVFDLDPDETLDFEVVALAAAVIRGRLDELGLASLPLVTGGKGVHVVAPLRRTAEWPRVKTFAQAFATRLSADEPSVFTATMSKSRRRGRIFIDWLRNERGATAIAPYSTRARENAPVATPVSWDELAQLQAANGFRIDDVVERLDQPDPWKAFGSWQQSVTARMLSTMQERNEG